MCWGSQYFESNIFLECQLPSTGYTVTYRADPHGLVEPQADIAIEAQHSARGNRVTHPNENNLASPATSCTTVLYAVKWSH